MYQEHIWNTIEPNDVAKIKANTTAAIEKMRKHRDIMAKFHRVLRTWHRKAINQRLITALKKELPNVSVICFEDCSTSFRQIAMWGGDVGLDYNSRLLIFIGYFSTNDPKNVCLADFDYDAWNEREGIRYGKYDEQISAKLIALRDIDKLVRNYNAAYKALKQADDGLDNLDLVA
jgi:hypothetical protein